MVHRLKREPGVALQALLERAREGHAAIGGLDAEAFAAMAGREPYRAGFSPYPGLIRRLSTTLGLQPPVVLDLGCGPGTLSGLLLREIPTLQAVAVDASPEMLAIARRDLAGYIGEGRLRVEEADLLAPLPRTGATIAVLKGTAHHINALERALAGLRAAVGDTTVLVVHDYRRDGDPATLIPFVESLRLLPLDAFGLFTRILGYVDSRRVSYTRAEIEKALESAGWRVEAALESPDEIFLVALPSSCPAEPGVLRPGVVSELAAHGFTTPVGGIR